MKRPSFQFYPADWRKDPALRACSIEARGFWIDLLCIMHESENCGFLEINSKKISEKALASMCGITPSKCRKFLAELEDHGVFSKDERGVIYSRRMVRDKELSEIRREAGKQGGNPKLVKQEVKQKPADLLNQTGNQNPTPSSSSSSSTSVGTKPTTTSNLRGHPPTNGHAAVVVAGDGDWANDYPTGTAQLMAEVQARINRLHPSWTKRPHWSAKELHALSDNASAWLKVEPADWNLLAFYMSAAIPSEWRRDPRDFPQPDNRLGIINMGPSSILSFADNWLRRCKREGIQTNLKPEKQTA